MRMNTSAQLGLAAALVLSLGACATSKRCNVDAAYLEAEYLPDLIVPAGMTAPPHDRAMTIPNEERLAYGRPPEDSQVCIAAPPPLATVEVERERRGLTRDELPPELGGPRRDDDRR